MNENKEFEHEIDPDLLAEIEEWEKADNDEPAEYYFSNPDPYLKPQPLPPDHPRHNCYFNEGGHLCVKNLSAFWLPEFTLQKEIGGTVYTVTGSYDGVETLDRKMSASWAKSLQKRWRNRNDKFTKAWYNRSNQSCTGSCPIKGGNRNVTGN